MVDLVPSAPELALAAPVLGPWFSDSSIELPIANGDLSVTLAAGAFDWLPPATGLLSLVVASNPRPSLLATLRAASGSAAFSTDSLVALFRLLPEVETRLDALLADFIESADGVAVPPGVSRRARVRYFALEFQGGATLDDSIWDVDPPFTDGGSSASEQARHIGLSLQGGNLVNPITAPDQSPVHPMKDMRRPGLLQPPFVTAPNSKQPLIRLGANASGVKLWAFDQRGRPIDPGAVADWWLSLATIQFEDFHLWAPGIVTPALKRTVAVAEARTIHLVSANEGPIGDLSDEVAIGNTTGTGILRRQNSAAAVTVASNSTQIPVRVGLLPNGQYSDQVALWPVGTQSPTRDMVRVGVINVDLHLVGAAYPDDSIQTRAGVRPQVLPAQGEVLLADSEETSAALTGTLDGAGERRLVSSVLDQDFGALGPLVLPQIALQDFPNDVSLLSVSGLHGGGEATGDTVGPQKVFIEFQLDAGFAGAWLRCWTQGFDEDQARHIRLDGGAAPVGADGRARLVAELVAGQLQTSSKMGLDVILIARDASRIYNDLRFDRPTPVVGDALAVNAAAGPFLLCEMGLTVATEADLRNPGVILPGTTVVSLQSPPALVDRDSLSADHFADASVITQLTNGVAVSLTAPAFRRIPNGDDATQLSANGADIEVIDRDGTTILTEPGSPLPALERLEVAAGRVEGNQIEATIGTTPTLSRYHEFATHQLGHPGAPAATEFHGTGTQLTGIAAGPLIESLRDRTIRSTFERAIAAIDLLPNLVVPSIPSRWTALLRTVAPGVEGEPIVAPLVGAEGFPFGESLDDMLDWLGSRIPGGVPVALSGAVQQADAVARTLDRRMHTAGFGAHDALHSLEPAIKRAEDFIYIETPALDSLKIRSLAEPGPGPRSIWGHLVARVKQTPSLHVLVCFPEKLSPGMPRRLERIRNELIKATEKHPRILDFGVLTGPGRSLRMASTTVIIDDAYAMTGTTHLWRRGLTHDSSLALAVFDDELDNGRPQQITAFRRRLIADRLGLNQANLPDDPAELLLTIRQLQKRSGGGRLSTESLAPPDIESSPSDFDAWVPDGTTTDSFNFAQWFADLLLQIQLVNDSGDEL